MITGQFDVTMDEKGRLMVPAKLRSEINGNTIFVTQGYEDGNLWLFTPDEWAVFSNKVMSNMSPFSEEDRELYRDIISPAQELEIDRMRRILIPPSLKAYAKLKKEALILGVIKFIELWDAETYALHKKESKERGVSKENQKRLKERIFF